MSLDQVLQQTRSNKVTQRDIPLFLPPEYEIDLDGWRELIQTFNATDRRVKIAEVIKQYLRNKYPDKKDFDSVLSISEIVEKEGRFYTDLSFESDKPGLHTLVVFKSEDLQLAPITEFKGKSGIRHVVMTYVP